MVMPKSDHKVEAEIVGRSVSFLHKYHLFSITGFKYKKLFIFINHS